MKFQCIVADPPWTFKDKLSMSDVKRGAGSQYSLLDNKAIINLNISELADPDGAILALWVPSSLLNEGLEAMKNYGFEFKQTYIWVKIKDNPFNDLLKIISHEIKSFNFKTLKLKNLITNIKTKLFDYNVNSVLKFGMGRLFRQTHEICLIGINNKNIYKNLKNKSQRSVSLYKLLKHSEKPDNLQNSLDIMFDGNKLEVFARRQRSGWICIGNEAPNTLGQDITESINYLINN